MKKCYLSWSAVRSIQLLAFAGTLLTSVAGAQDAPKSNEGKSADAAVLGRIGQQEIKVDDVRAFLANLTPSQSEAVSRDPALLNQLVRSFLVQKIVLKEALEKKWDQEPEVADKLARLRESTVTDSYLQEICKPADNYPAEADIKAAYDATKAAMLVPRSFRLAQIFISDPKASADAEATGKAKEKVEALKKQLGQPGADFAAIATASSEERESASRGGEIGWLAETQIQPEIRDHLPKLELNAVSEPIRLADGWHVIKVLDAREAYTPTLEQVRGRLTEQLRADKLRANTQEYLAKLLLDHPIAINELLLSKVLDKAKP